MEVFITVGEWILLMCFSYLYIELLDFFMLHFYWSVLYQVVLCYWPVPFQAYSVVLLKPLLVKVSN